MPLGPSLIVTRGGDNKGRSLWLKSLGWNRTNHFYLGCRNIGLPYYHLQYERLAMNLEPELQKLMRFLELPFEAQQLRYHEIEQPAFSGNGELMQRKDSVRIRDTYIHELPTLEWWLTTCLTYPTNVRAGYPLTRRLPSA